MSTKADRQKYVLDNLGTYSDFLNEVQFGPFSDRDKMEFAAISANTAMGGAIDGFIASRDKESVTEIGEALLFWGVNAPFAKAAYCMGIRECDASLIPSPDGNMLEQREKCVPHIKGLGYAKYSFAASMIAPMESDIICIDTHMYQALMNGEIPNGKSLYGQSKKCIELYLDLETTLRVEAFEIEVPLFLYQWAVWDLQRGKIETHDFLWERGRSQFQATLEGLEIAG